MPSTTPALQPEVLDAIQAAVNRAMASRESAANLMARTNSLLTAGAPGPSTTPGSSGGKSPVIAPPLIGTFASCSVPWGPAGALTASALPASTTPVFSTGLSSTVTPLCQPFIVGPGYSPIPAKLVTQIVAGKFVDLNELLPANLTPSSESEPQVWFDGRMLFTNPPKKPKRGFEDIVSWTEAFSVYSLVLASRIPERWRDLLLYKLLIMRTYRQFSGRAWLAYDHAFREHAAAANISDWSQINVQLYNFHTAGSGPKPQPTVPGSTICTSWNRGSCASPYSPCRFAHQCLRCSGQHKALDCPVEQSTAKSAGHTRERHCVFTVYQPATWN
jgi:hypothetical protein